MRGPVPRDLAAAVVVAAIVAGAAVIAAGVAVAASTEQDYEDKYDPQTRVTTKRISAH